MRRRTMRQLLCDAIRAAEMETMSVRRLAPVEGPEQLPKSEAEVDDFIRARTRLYRDTWVLAPLREALARLPPLQSSRRRR